MSALFDGLNSACLSTFGEIAMYQCDVLPAEPFAVTVIRCAPSQFGDITPGRYLGLWAKYSDFAGPPAKGESVALAGETYIVVDIQTDEGGGGVTLTVSKQVT